MSDRRRELYFLIDSPFGTIGVEWSEDVSGPRVDRVHLMRVSFGAARGLVRDHPVAQEATCPEIAALAEGIGEFLEGRPRAFDLAICRMERCSLFQRAVLEREAQIPRGRVETYGSLAEEVGRPGAARAVGSALANNPFPLIVPCHRAVRSGGAVGGFQGGSEMKRALLEMEGVAFDDRGRVLPAFIGSRPGA